MSHDDASHHSPLSESSLSELLQNADARQIVQLAIRMLHAHHEHEAERLSLLLRGFNNSYMDLLAQHWVTLKAESPSMESALFRLIKKLRTNEEAF